MIFQFHFSREKFYSINYDRYQKFLKIFDYVFDYISIFDYLFLYPRKKFSRWMVDLQLHVTKGKELCITRAEEKMEDRPLFDYRQNSIHQFVLKREPCCIIGSYKYTSWKKEKKRKKKYNCGAELRETLFIRKSGKITETLFPST